MTFHHLWTVQAKRTTSIYCHYGCPYNTTVRFTSLTASLTQEQGATSCPCTSIDNCLRTEDQSLLQYSSVGMVTSQWQAKCYVHHCSSLDVRCHRKLIFKLQRQEGTLFLAVKWHSRLAT